MRQEEHIENLINQAHSVNEASSKIQKAYEAYVMSGTESSFNELLSLIDDRCIHNVRKLLWINGLYNDENEYEIIQNARISVWEFLKIMAKQECFRVHLKRMHTVFIIIKHLT